VGQVAEDSVAPRGFDPASSIAGAFGTARGRKALARLPVPTATSTTGAKGPNGKLASVARERPSVNEAAPATGSMYR
jgi:hypothetical protein